VLNSLRIIRIQELFSAASERNIFRDRIKIILEISTANREKQNIFRDSVKIIIIIIIYTQLQVKTHF
jgi:hypothetical protein